jgi:transcription antitermination factor NusA-like protein
MKTAICAFCAQTGMLCKDCQTKLAEGDITDTDIKIAKTAVDYEKNHPNAAKVTIVKTIERPEFILIIVSPGSKRFLVGGTQDFDIRLERVLNKPIKIMEKSKNKRATIDEIFSPALVSGINTVFVPIRSQKPGQSSVEEEIIVMFSPDEKEKLPGTVSDLIDLVKLITGESIRVEFR